MLGTLKKLFIPPPPKAVEDTYIALVAAARNPFFYTVLTVPDSIDGRFGMIVVHLFLLEFRLLKGEFISASRLMGASPSNPLPSGSPEGLRTPTPTSKQTTNHAFAQFLSEAFFNDMDNSLREIGVGDTGVSHRIKKMGKAYHGCLQAYAAGLNDPQLLRSALARNLYGTVENGDVAMLDRMANYIEKMIAALAEADINTITSGQYVWPDAAEMRI